MIFLPISLYLSLFFYLYLRLWFDLVFFSVCVCVSLAVSIVSLLVQLWMRGANSSNLSDTSSIRLFRTPIFSVSSRVIDISANSGSISTESDPHDDIN
jgi:hypothetical protein